MALRSAIGLLWCVAAASAQDHADPSHDPALTSPSVTDRIHAMESPVVSRDPVKPDGSASPGASAPLREGSFLSARRGRLAQHPDGWAFYFDADATGRSDAPVWMQPCSTLSAMLRLMESRRESTTFFMSGEVFAYDGRNYVLPTYFTIAAARTQEIEAAGPEVEPSPEDGASSEPTASSLISGVERATSARRIAPVSAAPEGGARVVREGEFFNLRRARIMPEASGDWRATFDTGTDNASNDPPMTLMACQTLARLEVLSRSAREGLTVTLSGRVYVFEGRNYLLPTLFFVDYTSAAAEIRSAQ